MVFAKRFKASSGCNQVTSFGWSSHCVGAGRLSMVLLAVLMLAASYGASVAGFEARTFAPPSEQFSLSVSGESDKLIAAISLVPIASMNSHG